LLRIAAVSYLNAVPLVWGLQRGPAREQFQVEVMLPSACADALRNGAVDAGIIPSIEYQRIPDLQIVPGLSISSTGPVRSVMLIARVPLTDIRSVALDTSSRTSACLVQILLRNHVGVQPQFVPRAPDVPSMLGECDAALLIGDPALATDFPGLEVHDLAELWKAMTGLPFVFAFWAVRADAATGEVIRAFQQSTEYAFQHLDEIVQEESKRTGLARELVRTYLTENINFTLGERNLAGLRLFYSLAQELELIGEAKPLQLIAGENTTSGVSRGRSAR
jgi:chorismate dehydratase